MEMSSYTNLIVDTWKASKVGDTGPMLIRTRARANNSLFYVGMDVTILTHSVTKDGWAHPLLL